MLIAISHYTKPIEEVEPHRAEHLEFLKSALVATNKLLVAGRQTPPTGAVIIAKNTTREEFANILANDPYCKVGVAEYRIIEISPVLYDEILKDVVS